MSVRFQNQYFSFNKIQEVHEDVVNPNKSYVRFSMSSSRKRLDGTREYSDWFATARGEVADFIKSLVKRDFIVATGSFSRVPFTTADGTKKWGDAQIYIYEASKYIRPEEFEDRNGGESFPTKQPEISGDSPF